MQFSKIFLSETTRPRVYIWYIASSWGPLPKLFKLCPWGQNWPRPGGHSFTLIYIRKTSNDNFSLTTNGNLTKLHRNDPWVVPYQSCSNRSSWLHKLVTGSINRFLKWNFQKSSCLKLHGPELSYLVYSIIWRSSTKAFKLCPWGQNWPRPGGHNLTLNCIRKSSNDFCSWTANGNLTKLNRNGPWVVLYQNYLNGSDWLHK